MLHGNTGKELLGSRNSMCKGSEVEGIGHGEGLAEANVA